MKRAVIGSGLLILVLTCLFMWTQVPGSSAAEPAAKARADTQPTGGSTLPTEATAKDVLNSTGRHGEWNQVPAGSGTIPAFIVYPDRADKAPVLVITEQDQPLSDWLRAVADQAAQEGFIAVAPDLLSGLEPNRRIDTVRDYALKLPAANGRSASLTFYRRAGGQMDVVVNATAKHQQTFALSQQAWPDAIGFLNTYTENHPTLISLPPHSHTGHEALGLMAQAQRGGGRGERPCSVGSLDCKRDDIVAGFNTASSTVARSPIRLQELDIPAGTGKVRARITYPQGGGKAPVVIMMPGANGLNYWQRAVGDQLSREGFITIAADLHTGLGPNGGNIDSFEFPDDVVKANARLNPQETLLRYKAARDYALKLPEANGKSASIGFCGGGTRSFAFAGEVPELNAAVVYYGTAPDEATMAKIKAPVLAFYGEIDARITSTVEATTAQMKKLGKSYEPHIYKGATHSFLQYQNLGENAAATADSWPRTIAFLKQNTK